MGGRLWQLFRRSRLPENGFTWVSPLVALFTALAVFVLGGALVGAAEGGVESNAAKLAAQFVVVLGFTAGAATVAVLDAGGRFRVALDRFGLRRFGLAMVALAAGVWVVYAAVQGLLSPLLAADQDDITKELGSDPTSAASVLATVLVVVVGAAVSEELLFRGVVFASLRNAMGLWAAGALSSMLWGSLHLASGNLGVVLVLTLFGVVLAWLYEKTGSLWTPIVAHAINNALAVALLFT
jgi:membrane protease YdiL (CAAX protease family)